MIAHLFLALGAFFALFVVDVCWAYYINQVKDGSPLKASAWSAALYLVGASATVGIVGNPWLIIPAALGAFAGTYLGAKLNASK